MKRRQGRPSKKKPRACKCCGCFSTRKFPVDRFGLCSTCKATGCYMANYQPEIKA